MERPRRRPRLRRGLVVLAALALATTLAGCGADVERREAGAAADAFTASVASDVQAACDLLAPRTRESVEKDGTPCAQALPEAGVATPGRREAVTVAGHSAQARYTQGALFLARFEDGWRVTAAGCSRDSDDDAEPYDCTVEAG